MTGKRSKLNIRRKGTVTSNSVAGRISNVMQSAHECVENNFSEVHVEFGCEGNVNDEEVNESDGSEVEGDDCEVLCEDVAGNRGSELGEEELVDVEICNNLEEHFGDVAREDGNGNTDIGYDSDANDVWNETDIPDPLSEDEEEEECRPFSYGIGPDELLALGKTFSSADNFKYTLLRYSLKSQYDIKMYKSSSDRLGARCTDIDCPWRVYCSFEKSRNKLMIKVYINEHSCIRTGYTKLLKSGSIAQLFEERLRMNPKIKSQEMVDEIKREYNMIVSVHQCRRAKKVLADKRKASHETHFARIWDYQAEVLKTNEGSTMEIETIPGPTPGSKQRFFRLYICFEALKNAWKQSCRPIIGVDGAFPKWDIKGQMLAAVGRDGDNRIFPIAWAVVEVEDKDNWLWFIQLLKKDLDLKNGEDITIISDKQTGLCIAIHDELPQAEHRMCARHIVKNWTKNNKDIELERLFWKIARSYTTGEFADNLEAMKRYNLGAYESLQHTIPKSWSRAFFKLGSCCNDNLNNLSESFNRSIKESRRKPLLDMLEDIRRKCMVRNAKRTIISSRWKKRFTPKADAEIELNRRKGKECQRYMTTGNVHEIDLNGTAYSVDMGLKTCGCGYWQLNGIPCVHAMCVITTTKLVAEDYVSDYYTTSKWRQLYSRGIKLVQGMKLWPRLGRLPVLPPPSRFNRGRPNSYARRKSPHETSSNSGKLTRHNRIITCSKCKQEGHNKVRCPNAFAPPPAKKPRGRPKKNQGEFPEVGTSQVGSSHGQSQGSSQAGFGFGFSI